MKRFWQNPCGMIGLAALLATTSFAWAQAEADRGSTPDQPAEIEAPKVPPEEPTPEIAETQNDRRHQPIVAFGNDVTLGKDETSENVVVIFGSAKIDGEVTDSVVVIGGSAHINGKIRQNLVNVLGLTTLGPDAEIQGDAVMIGAQKIAPGARIRGERVAILLREKFPALTWFTDWFKQGLFRGRLLPPGVTWVWGVAIGCLLLYCLVALVFPRPVEACVRALEARPIGSFFLGILLFVLFGPLMLLLVFTGVGLLVIPFLLCAMVAAFLFGKVAVFRLVGEQLAGQMSPGKFPLPVVALVLGVLIFYLLYMVPILGFVAWGVAAPLALGASFLAIFGRSTTGGSNASPIPGGVPSTIMASPIVATVNQPAPGGNPGAAVPPVYATSSTSEMISAQALTLPRAGFWRRFLATALDLIMIGLLAVFLGRLLARAFPLFILVWLAYHIAMWTWKGTTVGGTIMRLKVVRTNGSPVDFGVALVRGLSSIFSAVVLFLGFFWAGWDSNKQSWHDKIAGTVVVKVPSGFSLI
jgi:uncharacterized RDD family membrane protein YckC